MILYDNPLKVFTCAFIFEGTRIFYTMEFLKLYMVLEIHEKMSSQAIKSI